MSSLVNLIPFRSLVAIGKTLGKGNLGFDANRVPGGKTGVADKLTSMYGEAAILALYRNEATPPPSDAQDAPNGDGGAPQGKADGDADAPEGDDSAPDADNAQDGNADGSQGEGDIPKDGDASEADADATPPANAEASDAAPQDGDAPEAQDLPPVPAPDAAPPEASGNPMDDHIRKIAKEVSDAGDAPVADWLNDALRPYLAAQNARIAALQAAYNAPGAPQSAPEDSGASAPVPARWKPAKGAPVQHRLFPKLLALVAAGAQVLLLGPAGTGKSHACKAVADALGRSFGSISLSSGASESNLTGWLLPVGDNGRFSYVASPFVTQYEKGSSVFLLDEIDAASPDMLVVVNAALANGGFTLAQRFDAPAIVRGANAAVIAAANTIDGADESYSARQSMDAATLDRFYVLRWDADEVLEAALIGAAHGRQNYWKPEAAPDTSPECARFIADWVQGLRRVAGKAGIQRVVSVRMMQRYQQAIAAGCTHKEAQSDLLNGWTKDELSRCGDYAPGKTVYHPHSAPAAASA
jgi:hypothetical protein